MWQQCTTAYARAYIAIAVLKDEIIVGFHANVRDKSTGCKKLILKIKVFNSVLSTFYLFVEVPQSWSIRYSVWFNSSNSQENKMSTTHPEVVTNLNLCVSAYVASNKPLYKLVLNKEGNLIRLYPSVKAWLVHTFCPGYKGF